MQSQCTNEIRKLSKSNFPIFTTFHVLVTVALRVNNFQIYIIMSVRVCVELLF